MAKWLSVRLRTKWFWVRVQLQSLKKLLFYREYVMDTASLNEVFKLKMCNYTKILYFIEECKFFHLRNFKQEVICSSLLYYSSLISFFFVNFTLFLSILKKLEHFLVDLTYFVSVLILCIFSQDLFQELV